MTCHDLSAHTYRDQDDPGTVLRYFRRTASGVAVGVALLSLAGMAVGLWEDNLRVWNLGLTGLVVAVLSGAVAAGAYIVELTEQGRRGDRVQIAELCDQVTELRDRFGEILRRLADVEAGERALAGAVRDITDPPDELGERRRGGGQS